MCTVSSMETTTPTNTSRTREWEVPQVPLVSLHHMIISSFSGYHDTKACTKKRKRRLFHSLLRRLTVGVSSY
ncbi:hypothetical protein KP509_24G064400 [Ceratopteris richardii]|uniref:Uncharacterized protein n=1 Tax=Ceratopteris richardii TaxID=49495 RepID=A0A8T2RVY3_CERRI|nr:hypothetical protein KP509_24G064400 [Ceratopteris richardii]